MKLEDLSNTRMLEHVLHISRWAAKDSPCDYLHLVAATELGDVQPIEVSEDHEFRRVLYEALCADFVALGLLGFEQFEGEIQARSILFQWHSDDERLPGLFERLCYQAVRNVQTEFEERQRVH